MNSASVLLITQLLALAAQVANQVITLRQQEANNQSATLDANLAGAEANLQTVIDHAKAALASVPVPAIPAPNAPTAGSVLQK